MRDYQNLKCPLNKAGRKSFHYRVADEEISTKMTGYSHNGVTPFLLGNVLKDILVSDSLKFGVGKSQWVQSFWLGGGNVDVKLSIF